MTTRVEYTIDLTRGIAMGVSALSSVVLAMAGIVGGCSVSPVKDVVVHGHVLDGNSQPVAGLRLYVADLKAGSPIYRPPGEQAYVHTDAEGRYSFRFEKLHGPLSISVLEVDKHAACPRRASSGNDAALIDEASLAGAREIHQDLEYCDPTPQQRALSGALQVAKATQELDVAALVRATPPELRSAVGGDEKLRERLEQKLVGKQSHRKGPIESVSIGQPTKMALDGNIRYIFFPYTLAERCSGRQIITRAFYLAVSRDSGATWHYADALYYPDGVSLAAGIKDLVSGYNDEPPLPVVESWYSASDYDWDYRCL